MTSKVIGSMKENVFQDSLSLIFCPSGLLIIAPKSKEWILDWINFQIPHSFYLLGQLKEVSSEETKIYFTCLWFSLGRIFSWHTYSCCSAHLNYLNIGASLEIHLEGSRANLKVWGSLHSYLHQSLETFGIHIDVAFFQLAFAICARVRKPNSMSQLFILLWNWWTVEWVLTGSLKYWILGNNRF